MAENKIDRFEKEIQRTKEKIIEYQNKLKTLETQKTEAENLQIVQLVRAVRVSPKELSAMLANNLSTPLSQNFTESEETENEE